MLINYEKDVMEHLDYNLYDYKNCNHKYFSKCKRLLRCDIDNNGCLLIRDGINEIMKQFPFIP